MGKGAELWDDSALINAFDAAMASYKELHIKSSSGQALEEDRDESEGKGNNTLPTHEKDENNSKEIHLLLDDAKSKTKIESKESSHLVDSYMKETCGSSCDRSVAMDDPFIQPEDIHNTSAAFEFTAPMSDHPIVDPKLDGYSDHQILNYNELLKQYYELEHRKEKITEQLWQANHWNYQTPAQYSSTQEQQVPVINGSEPSLNISCPCCTCHCLTTASTPISCPMAGSLSMGYSCCPRLVCCYGSQDHQDAGEKKGGEYEASSIFKSKELSNTCPEADLSSVLNAWYWAGYKTGRYLLKQEQIKQDGSKEG